MASQLQNTLVNGVRYSWTSLRIQINGQVYPGNPFRSINYSDKQEPVKVYGTSPRPIGRTRGQYLASGDCEIYRSEWQDFVSTLITGINDPAAKVGAIGFHDVTFQISVSYAEPLSPVLTDNLLSVRISDNASGNSNGADPSVIKMTLDIMEISWAGVPGVASVASTT